MFLRGERHEWRGWGIGRAKFIMKQKGEGTKFGAEWKQSNLK